MVFDENLLETAPSVEKSNENIQYIDEFLSTDRSIEYTLNINQVLNTTTMPVVEVVPHKFLSEDVKSVANVLFDGGTFYEREPTKNQIQNAIVRFLLIRSSLLCIYSKPNYRWFSGWWHGNPSGNATCMGNHCGSTGSHRAGN